MIKKIAVLAGCIAFSSTAMASRFSCTDYAKGPHINTGGNVYIADFNGWSDLRLCNITQTVDGVHPETCKVAYSTLLAADLADRKVTLWFNGEYVNPDDGSRITSCTSRRDDWELATDWYHGPLVEK